MGSLTGRSIAITGASAGIGRACAEHIVAEGAAVALSARRADLLEELAAGFRNRGGQAIAVAGDITSEETARQLVDSAIAAFGHLDVMICNAGIGFHGTIEETAADVMRRLLEVNYMGTYLAARAALPVFRQQNRGHLVIVSSIVGQRGVALMGGYCATKFAQVGLAESLRAELASTNIHVSVVCPVSTETEFIVAMQRDYGQGTVGRGPRQPADAVARAIVRCLKKPRPEVYPYPLARGLVVLNAIAPGWLDKFVKRYRRNRT